MKKTTEQLIYDHLDFIQTSSDKTCQYLSGKNVNTIQYFCLGLLRRIDDTATSTKTLFELLGQNHKHKYAIGIMFRALILDTLISIYLYKRVKDIEVECETEEEKKLSIEDICNSFLSDGLNQTLSYIQLAEELKKKTNAETKVAYKNMEKKYAQFFDGYLDKNGIRPKPKYKTYNARELFCILEKDSNLKDVPNIYDFYSYLSKYDHFGIQYYDVINEECEEELKINFTASEIFVAHHNFLHIILAKYSQNDTFLNNQSKLAGEYLLNNVVNK